MLAALEIEAVLVHPLLEMRRAGENTNALAFFQAVTSLGADEPGVILEIFFSDCRGRNPQLVDTDALVVLIALRVREPEKLPEIPCNGHRRDG